MKNGKLTRSEAKEMYEMGIDQVKNVLNRGSYSATREDVISILKNVRSLCTSRESCSGCPYCAYDGSLCVLTHGKDMKSPQFWNLSSFVEEDEEMRVLMLEDFRGLAE